MRNTHSGTKEGHFSTARLVDDWYIVCSSQELGRQAISRRLWGTPIVLFRGEGGADLAPCSIAVLTGTLPFRLAESCATESNVPITAGNSMAVASVARSLDS